MTSSGRPRLIDLLAIPLLNTGDDAYWAGVGLVPLEPLRQAAQFAGMIRYGADPSSGSFGPDLDCSRMPGFEVFALDAYGNQADPNDYRISRLMLCQPALDPAGVVMDICCEGIATCADYGFQVRATLPVSDVLTVADTLANAREPQQLQGPSYQHSTRPDGDEPWGVLGLLRVHDFLAPADPLCLALAARTLLSTEPEFSMGWLRENRSTLAARIDAGQMSLQQMRIASRPLLGESATAADHGGLGL